MKPKTGDLCWIQGNFKRHYGICTGRDSAEVLWFIHSTPGKGVVWAPRKAFGGNRPIHVEVSAHPDDVSIILENAQAAVGQAYNVFAANCEHFAREAATGRRESKQVQKAVIFGSILTVVATAVANENGTHTDGNGYRRNNRGQFGARRWW